MKLTHERSLGMVLPGCHVICLLASVMNEVLVEDSLAGVVFELRVYLLMRYQLLEMRR